jgi:L-arabinonolactonase
VIETNAALALDQRCTLGEGLLWDPAAAQWLWTDIEASCLHAWAWPHGPVRTLTLPDRLGSFARCRSGRLLLGLAKGLAWGEFSNDTLAVTPLVAVEADEPRTRINDGRTDRSGNFVFGTFNQSPDRRPIGGFYQYASTHGLRRLALPPVGIANSICFSPDGATLYFTDTAVGRIMQCRYDSSSAQVDDIRLFAVVNEPGASPDGSIVDSDGCLWNAQWGAGRVRRFSPRGEPLETITLDAPNASCPALGGPDLHDLMITSARIEMSDEQLAMAPAAGGLFHVHLPTVTGLPDALFED